MTEGYIEKSIRVEESDIDKINRFTKAQFDIDRLYVFSVVLCNNDIDRDNEKFSIESLNQLSTLFLGKTGISDHSMKSSDQKARIFDTKVEKLEGRKTADGEDFYQLKAKAYMVKSQENMPLITEIEAGIKKEVSISCSMGKSICSICGADKRSMQCEHISGREYKGKTAFTVLSDARDAYEFSFVAVPAQREAGVTKSFNLMEESSNMTEIIKSLRGCKKEIVLSKEQADFLTEYIETLTEEAKLGKEYKKNLADEVVRLCALSMPDMDLKVFQGVAQVMTTKELLSFKKAFTKSSEADEIKPQLHSNKKADRINFSQFKI